MVSNNVLGGHALRIVVGFLMVALFFTYSASAVTLAVEDGSVASGPMTWTASNFPAFWHEDGISGETLSVNQNDLSESQRVINRDNLVYSSTKRVVPYKIYTETGLAVWNGLDAYGSRVISGGYYAKVGWLGKPYVAANGQAFKLSEIILEQNSTDLKNLNVNETWNLGKDYNLTLIALDKNARQALFNLSNKSGIISEFIVEEGNSNTVWRNLADESDAPFFVTYMDNISENSVRLKYTWMISDNVTIINSGDRFGIMEVRSYNSDGFSLSNENPITLLRGSTVNLLEGFDLVVNDNPLLEYYPRMLLTSDDIVSQYAGSDGIVQRDEAVKAVIDYFNELITKEDAIKVITAYFSS